MNSFEIKILEILSENNDCVSGNFIGKELGISRTMVWKYIAQLNEKGYIIESNKKGYKLSSELGLPTEFEILSRLYQKDYEFHIMQTVDSTSTYLRNLNCEKEKTVAIANEQTRGRGRRGKTFYSPDNSGIYMSILLKPDIPMNKAVLITTTAAVAVCRAIEKVLNISPQIKWVNDIYVNNKKVCGILTEAVCDVETGELNSVILGVGVNVSLEQKDFPPEIRDIAASLKQSKDNLRIIKTSLIAEILNEFFDFYKSLDAKEIYNEYKSRMFLIGRDIEVLGIENYSARVLDLAEDYSLVIKKESGEIEHLSSGEVSTRFS